MKLHKSYGLRCVCDFHSTLCVGIVTHHCMSMICIYSFSTGILFPIRSLFLLTSNVYLSNSIPHMCIWFMHTNHNQNVFFFISGALTKSQFPVFTIYAQKSCLSVRPCSRAWCIDRVQNYKLAGFTKRSTAASSRQDCFEMCLGENEFTCRYVNYWITSSISIANERAFSVQTVLSRVLWLFFGSFIITIFLFICPRSVPWSSIQTRRYLYSIIRVSWNVEIEKSSEPRVYECVWYAIRVVSSPIISVLVCFLLPRRPIVPYSSVNSKYKKLKPAPVIFEFLVAECLFVKFFKGLSPSTLCTAHVQTCIIS